MGIGSPIVLKSSQLDNPSALSWTGTQQPRKNLGYGMPPLYPGTQILLMLGILINSSNKGLALQGAIKEKCEDHL
jgi:hypothetical protein